MKIDIQNEVRKAHLQQSGTARPQAGSGAFAELLKTRLAAGEAEKTAAVPSGPVPLSGVQMTAPLQPGTFSPLEGTERLLSLMDAYRGQLTDGGASLRQIEPTVRRMAEALPELEASCERLPADDGLRQVANEAMVAARTEILRFERGDYIA